MITRTPADDWFSKAIRIRSNFTCDHCGIIFPGFCRELHCSHGYGRSNLSVRFDIDNAFSHCASCHKTLGGNPFEFFKSVEALIGAGRIEMVMDRSRDTGLGRMARRGNKDGSIAAHYREEVRRIERLRRDGEVGRLEVENWV